MKVAQVLNLEELQIIEFGKHCVFFRLTFCLSLFRYNTKNVTAATEKPLLV